MPNIIHSLNSTNEHFNIFSPTFLKRKSTTDNFFITFEAIIINYLTNGNSSH